MKKLEIVSMVKVDGVWMRQEEVPCDKLQKLIETRVDEAMKELKFRRIRPPTK